MHDEKVLAQYAALKEYAAAHPRLRYLFLELTSKCNLKCRHCGSRCPSNIAGSQVDTPRLLRLIDEVTEHIPPREFMFCITGGEPLLRPDWDKICAYIAEKGYSWGMTTNGTLITEDVVRRMEETGMKTIAVSLDGLRESHEWLRNVKGSYEQALHGLELLVRSGQFQRVQVTTVVNTKSLHDLEEMYHLLKDMGVLSWKIVATEPIGSAVGQKELFLSPAQYRQMLDFILEKRASGGMEVTFGCSHFLPEEYENTVRRSRFHCGAGVFIASISAKGKILACLDIDDREAACQGSIYTDSFWETWQNKFTLFRSMRNLENAECAGCPHQRFCRGDSWHTWDFEKSAPRICLIHYLEKEN